MSTAILALALIAPSLALAPAAQESYTARVVGFSDGDTLTVLTTQKKQVKIDAPETGQDFGSRSRQSAPTSPSARR